MYALFLLAYVGATFVSITVPNVFVNIVIEITTAVCQKNLISRNWKMYLNTKTYTQTHMHIFM